MRVESCTSENDSNSYTSGNDDDETPPLSTDQNWSKNYKAVWSSTTSNFITRLVPSQPCPPELHPTLNSCSRVLKIFFKLFHMVCLY